MPYWRPRSYFDLDEAHYGRKRFRRFARPPCADLPRPRDRNAAGENGYKRRTMPSQTTPACAPCRIKVLSHLSMHSSDRSVGEPRWSISPIPKTRLVRMCEWRSGLHKEMPRDALVLDCAYEEYVDSPDHDGTDLVESADNIVISRTFSKSRHGRCAVGWMYAPPISRKSTQSLDDLPVADALRRGFGSAQGWAHFDHVSRRR